MNTIDYNKLTKEELIKMHKKCYADLLYSRKELEVEKYEADKDIKIRRQLWKENQELKKQLNKIEDFDFVSLYPFKFKDKLITMPLRDFGDSFHLNSSI